LPSLPPALTSKPRWCRRNPGWGSHGHGFLGASLHAGGILAPLWDPSHGELDPPNPIANRTRTAVARPIGLHAAWHQGGGGMAPLLSTWPPLPLNHTQPKSATHTTAGAHADQSPATQSFHRRTRHHHHHLHPGYPTPVRKKGSGEASGRKARASKAVLPPGGRRSYRPSEGPPKTTTTTKARLGRAKGYVGRLGCGYSPPGPGGGRPPKPPGGPP
jgi:hypothetical protein